MGQHKTTRAWLEAEAGSLEELATELSAIPDARERLIVFAQRLLDQLGVTEIPGDAPSAEPSAKVSTYQLSGPPAGVDTGQQAELPAWLLPVLARGLNPMTEPHSRTFGMTKVPYGRHRGRLIQDLTRPQLEELASPDGFRVWVWRYLAFLDAKEEA